jgi:DNA-binding phage protein
MEDIKKTIRDLIRQKGTIRKTATDLGMDHANLLRSLREDANPGLKTIQKIVDYLGYEIRFFKKRKLRGSRNEKRRAD